MTAGRLRLAGAVPLTLLVLSFLIGSGHGAEGDSSPFWRWKGHWVFLPKPMTSDDDIRSIDGIGNNEYDQLYGCAGYTLLRVCPDDYGDGDYTMAGADRKSPREISNLVCAQTSSVENEVDASDFVWQWGQFLDHDIDLTPLAYPAETAFIPVPKGDPWFDPSNSGTVVIPFERSAYAASSSPRQQINEITSFIDASNVYGSDETRALALRTLDGTGRLKTSAGDLLPWNTAGLPNAPGPSASFFLAGDVRANEQVALTALHTLFVREHNRLADYFRTNHPDLTGDEIYESARRIVGAEMQGFQRADGLPVVPDGGTLVVIGDALRNAPAGYGTNAGFFLYLGSQLPPAVGGATAVLPVTTAAEMDGTFVNYEGRVQRFHQALRAPGVARPAWMALSRLLERCGAGETVLEVRAAFSAVAAGTAALEGLSWQGLGLRGELLSEAGEPAIAAE